MNERDAAGFLPIHFAALKGQIGLLRRILQLATDRKADVKSMVNDTKNDRQQSPLHWTCSKNQLAAAIVLVDVRLEKKKKTEEKKKGKFNLSQAGADPNLPDVDGYTPTITGVQ